MSSVIENYRTSRFFQVKNQKIIYATYCHNCEQHIFRTKQPHQNNNLEHECGHQTELLPWWVVRQDMDQNTVLQDRYTKALYSQNQGEAP